MGVLRDRGVGDGVKGSGRLRDQGLMDEGVKGSGRLKDKRLRNGGRVRDKGVKGMIGDLRNQGSWILGIREQPTGSTTLRVTQPLATLCVELLETTALTPYYARFLQRWGHQLLSPPL